MTQQTIAYAAGKSGGHIIPCMTLFHSAKEKNNALKGLFFTTNAPLDAVVLPDGADDITVCRLPLHTRVRNPFRFLFVAVGLIHSCFKSFWYLLKHKPARIVTTGGITAVPVCVMGYILGIPIDLYELNAVVGRATRFLSAFASRVMICFPEAQSSLRSKACTLTQYPIRFATANLMDDHDAMRQAVELAPHVPTLLILGGSQGSVQLNKLVKQALSSYAKPVQVIHQTGSNDTFDWSAWYQERGISALVFPYRDDLSPYIIMSDVVVCRAGAGTLFECMAYQKKMIVVPLEGVAEDHQVANAYAFQRRYQDAVVLRQQRLDHHATLLIGTIDTLIYPPMRTSFNANTDTLVSSKS